MSSRDWILLIALSVLWGGSFFFAKVAVTELPPLTVVLGRVGLASAALLVFVLAARRVIPWRREVWTAFFGMAILNNIIPFSLIFWGQTALPAGLTAIVNATTPLFTVLVMHVMTADEKATGPKLVGVALGFAGVLVLVGPALAGLLDTPLWALLVCLGAALSYAFAGLYGRRFKALGVDPAVTAWGQVTASTLIMLPIAAVADRFWTLPTPSAAAVLAMIGLAVLSTALAYVLFFRILATAGPTNLLLVTFLIPVSAILLGWLLLGETLALTHFLGMALIGAGLAAIDGRLWRAARARA